MFFLFLIIGGIAIIINIEYQQTTMLVLSIIAVFGIIITRYMMMYFAKRNARLYYEDSDEIELIVKSDPTIIPDWITHINMLFSFAIILIIIISFF